MLGDMRLLISQRCAALPSLVDLSRFIPGLTNAPYDFMSGETYLNPLRASLPTPFFPETTFSLHP